ncbi:MAG: hypothetical protein WBA99_18695, partial [Nodosilinea sp.]
VSVTAPAAARVREPIATHSVPMTATAPAPALPTYLTSSGKASPSPLVYPLRSQKKIKTIAAVELPSFGRTVRRR